MHNICFTNPKHTLCLFFLLAVFSLSACNKYDKSDPKLRGKRMEQFSTSKKYPAKFADESLEAWKKKLPNIKQISITSTADGKKQPALYFDSESKQAKPLLVVLHSWSSEYLQEVSIPYGMWAKWNDWVMIHPNYRGAFKNPEAMASDLAIQDIVDAVNYAKQNSNIDASRVYIVGSSGGAMTALVAAGRHPDIWAGVVAWVPVFNLVDWYAFSQNYPHRDYNTHIVTACGGQPLPGTPAAEECLRRSPSTYIQNLKDVPVFLSHGIVDVLVPADHSIRAYNILANPADTLSQAQTDFIVKEQALPEDLQGKYQSKYFGPKDPELVFERQSANVWLYLYNGVHDMAYNPSLLWLSEQKKNMPIAEKQ